MSAQNLISVRTDDINLTNKINISQGSSLTTTVTANGHSGFITTYNATLATQGSAVFTCNNKFVTPSNIVLATIQNYSGTGKPIITLSGVTYGSFSVKVSNADIISALNAPVKFGFLVI